MNFGGWGKEENTGEEWEKVWEGENGEKMEKGWREGGYVWIGEGWDLGCR